MSPTRTLSTAAPTSMTSPTFSWSKMAWLEVGAALVHVQVRAADIGAGDPDQDVGRFLDPGVRDIVHADLPRSVVHHRFHKLDSFRSQCATRRAANCSTMAGQNARRPSGERLWVKWTSTTTSL